MNKLSIMAKSVVVAMGMVGIAHAELNSWTGLYAGVNAGFAFNNAQVTSQQLGFTNPSENCNTSSGYSASFSGMQIGYMHQFPNYVVSGMEANITLNTNQKDALSCNSSINPNVYDRFTLRNQMQTSIKGRVGRALNWHQNFLLPYITAGASFANVGLTYTNEGNDYYSTNTTQAGLLVGAGIEWAFRQHWSLRAEYYYIDYSTIKMNVPNVYGLVDPNGNAHVNLSSNNVAVALNYRI